MQHTQLTPLQLELMALGVTYVLPALLAALGTLIAAWWTSQNRRLDALARATASLGADVDSVKTSISEIQIETTHRFDRLVGDVNVRLTRVESVCQMQHGINFVRPLQPFNGDWGHNSDVRGDSVRGS